MPVPDEGDVVSVGWYDIADGEMFEDRDGPFRVLDRWYYYIDRRNYDENEAGIFTLVTVVPA